MTRAEIADVVALQNRAQRADGLDQQWAVDEFTEDLDGDGVDLSTDTRVAVIDGRVVGYTYTIYRPAEVVNERAYVMGEVDPAFRGRGIGRRLVAWGTERAAQQLATSPRRIPRHVRAVALETAVASQRLLQRMGFRQVRYHQDLLRPLTDLPARREVAGIRLVPWPAERDLDVLAERNESWRDHWGSTPTSPADWHGSVHGFGSRLDLSVIAVDAATDDVVGHCLCQRFEADDELTGRIDGHVANLGTLQRYRKRGVGSAMVIESLHRMRAAGLDHATINVDSENPTGAARLYRTLGFEPYGGSFTYDYVGDAPGDAPGVSR